ncbi:MAG: biotin--[acetyl-CoA-carboxylase] ligase, partial [Clostridiales bacterium]|nr:biotin--[acetyl-CoA-carboxylase] ligase [Clostridiales bacterium]
MALQDQVLEYLESNRGEAVSGQALAELFHVSRNAVWKAVQALREMGYPIASATNRGYCLPESADLVSAAGIRAFLPEGLRGLPVHYFPCVDSTSNAAKRMALDGAPHGTCVAAEQQTAGRGRRGRSFFSPRGRGMYLSMVLRPQREIQDALLITLMAGVAVCRAVESLSAYRPQIKWVNDIFLDGKKFCGILSEAVTDFESGTVDSIVVGIGINVKTKREEFPEELREKAASLELEDLARNRLYAAVIAEMMRLAADWDRPRVLEEYRARSLMIGREIAYWKNGVQYAGCAREIDDNGNLVVEDSQGNLQVLSS